MHVRPGSGHKMMWAQLVKRCHRSPPLPSDLAQLIKGGHSKLVKPLEQFRGTLIHERIYPRSAREIVNLAPATLFTLTRRVTLPTKIRASLGALFDPDESEIDIVDGAIRIGFAALDLLRELTRCTWETYRAPS